MKKATHQYLRLTQKNSDLSFISRIVLLLICLLFASESWSISLDCQLDGLVDKKSTGILYRIKRPNAPDAFLFGTMHIGYRNFQVPPESVLNALKNAAIYVTESPIRGEARKNVTQMLYLDNGQSLKKMLSETTYEEYQTWLHRIGVSTVQQAAMDKWSPFHIMNLLEYQHPETKDIRRLDESMLQEAIRNNSEIAFVESSDELMSGFNSITNEEWDNLMNAALEEDKCVKCRKERLHYTKCILEFVRTGDADGLLELQEKFLLGRSAEKNSEEKIIYSRNEHQANNIGQLLLSRKEPMFISIGAAHIGGKLGVVQRLRSKGFELDQLK